MKLSNVILDLDIVSAVAEQKVIERGSAEDKGPTGGYVSAEVLADTARQYPECRCNELGLEAGFPVNELITLQEGCTEHVHVPPQRWVCPRLNTIRSIYRPWAKTRQRDAATNMATIAEHFDEEDE